MIYICVDQKDIASANQWVKDNIDHEGGDKTFMPNYKDSNGTLVAVIGIIDNGSEYSEQMKSRFEYFDTIEVATSGLVEI